MRRATPGQYQVQAAIAALHAHAASPDKTDWAQIAALYGLLARLVPSPVVELNKAVAVAMADGPDRGLQLIDRPDVSEPLDGYRWFHSARADLLRRLERLEDAAAAYRRALALSENSFERAFLSRRLAEVESAASPGPVV